MTSSRPGMFFRNRSEWRAWLRLHHDCETEAWVAHVKKASKRRGLSYDEGVEEALCFGWIDGLTRSLGADFFLQRYTPRKLDSVWSENNKARVEKLIRQRRMTRAGLRHVEAAQADGRWQAAAQRQDPDWIPEALAAALAQQPGALEAYLSLPPSLRQMHGHAIETAKRPGTREKRIRAAIDAAVRRQDARDLAAKSLRKQRLQKKTPSQG
jgi:uncharacterized protein YdeI (YjbR/CyaY-like superfamily)